MRTKTKVRISNKVSALIFTVISLAAIGGFSYVFLGGLNLQTKSVQKSGPPYYDNFECDLNRTVADQPQSIFTSDVDGVVDIKDLTVVKDSALGKYGATTLTISSTGAVSNQRPCTDLNRDLTIDAVDVQLMENYYASLKSGGTNKLPYTKEYNRLGDFYYYYSSTDNVWSVDQNSSQANANYAASSYPYNRVSIGYETLDSIAASQDIKQIDNYLALVKRQNPGNADSLIKSSINSKPVIYYRDKNATYTADYGKYMFGCQVIWLTNNIKGKITYVVFSRLILTSLANPFPYYVNPLNCLGNAEGLRIYNKYLLIYPNVLHN